MQRVMKNADLVTVAILGAGSRGKLFGNWIGEHPDIARVVAVAEPNRNCRESAGDRWEIPPENRFADWKELLARPRLGDAVINTTMDGVHAASSVAAMSAGYHMLLEKPMATTLEDCAAIDEARRKHGRIVSVCHSLRFRGVSNELKRLLDEGELGELLCFDAMEGIDPVHHAHSYVRGNWANESRSMFMLMAKSCHDLDLFSWLVGRPCERVGSFGSLGCFRPENAPPGAPRRCTDGCPHEAGCLYSAWKLYGPEASTDNWYRKAKLPADPKARRKALPDSPYSRCVWRCDNDVVDHQVVNFEFEGGLTGSFTLSGLWRPQERRIRLYGTKGCASAAMDGGRVHFRRYSDDAECVFYVPEPEEGHGGADYKLIRDFLDRVREGNPANIPTGTGPSLESHRIAFAAELARREGRVVEMSELKVPEGFRLPVAVR